MLQSLSRILIYFINQHKYSNYAGIATKKANREALLNYMDKKTKWR